MKPTQKLLPFRVPANTAEALEQLRTSYNGIVADALLAADRAVQRVVEITLRNASKTERMA